MTEVQHGRPRRRWRVLRLFVPIVLLVVVFRGVDLRQLANSLAQASTGLLFGGFLLGYLLPIALSTWRWQLTLRHLFGIVAPYHELLRTYWVGMFVGYLVPSGVGADLYRIASAGSVNAPVRVRAAVVLGEKLSALVVNALVFLAAYPLIKWRFTDRRLWDGLVMQVRERGSWIVLVGVGCAVVVLGWWQANRVRAGTIRGRVAELVDSLLPSEGGESLDALIRPFLRVRSQATLGAVSLLNQIVGSVGGMLMMAAIGVHLPLSVHLFVWAGIFLALLLPISVGTLGVREAAYVVAFGSFGVDRETALAGSIVGLGCMWATIGIGGLLAVFPVQGSERGRREKL